MSADLLQRRTERLSGQQPTYAPKTVVYVMSRDVRIVDNYGLIAAQQKALEHALPLVVVFILHDHVVGFRAREHVNFLLQAVKDTFKELSEYTISSAVATGDPIECLQRIENALRPLAMYHDFNPLRGPRALLARWAKAAHCPQFRVDSHNIVPMQLVSDKQEYAARTIRPKIHKHLQDFLADDSQVQKHPHLYDEQPTIAATAEEIESIVSSYTKNNTDISRFTPSLSGTQSALQDFIECRLSGYAHKRNDPTLQGLSHLSPYLHFGLLSSKQAVQEVQAKVHANSASYNDVDKFIEEIVVRKELSDNYCYHNDNYTSFAGAADWAQKTLNEHESDIREHIYSYEEFERAKTHDDAWNAAQVQLTSTGKMHGYMRMYWAKKVLEWTPNARTAIDYLIRLNDFYSLDGNDPNGYVGILWSVAGLHDHGWRERSVYGTVRSMVYSGLKRKFNIEKYIDKHR